MPKLLTLRSVPPLSNVPMPRSLFLLTIASLLGAFISLILSMLDLGILSLYVTPPVAIITIVFLAVVLVIAHRKREEGYPSYYSTTVLSAYIIALGWLIGFITTVAVLATGRAIDYEVAKLYLHGVASNIHLQRFQCFMTLVEFALVGALGLCGHLIARREGEPESWRPNNKDEGFAGTARHDEEVKSDL